MDLSELKPTERVIDILHPGTGEELGIKVTLVSINDQRLKNIKRKIQNDRMALERRGKVLKPDDIEQNRLDLCCAAMTGWSWEGEINFNGDKPKFSPKNIKDVFAALPWFQDQIEEAVSDESAFFQT